MNELPDKLLTRIGTQGLTLSGDNVNDCQLHVPLVANPKLLILDEATSALDSHSERKIQDAIHSLKGCSQLLLLHIAYPPLDSSNIIFIDNGEIKESGTHSQLMANQSHHYDWFRNKPLSSLIPTICLITFKTQDLSPK